MGKVELKPCPFCGSDAELREHWGDCSKGPLWYEVECKDPDCGRCQDSPEEAIAAWNKRPDADYRALRTVVAVLVEAAIKLHDRICDCDATGDGWLYPSIYVDDFTVLKAALDAAKEVG